MQLVRTLAVQEQVQRRILVLGPLAAQFLNCPSNALVGALQQAQTLNAQSSQGVIAEPTQPEPPGWRTIFQHACK